MEAKERMLHNYNKSQIAILDKAKSSKSTKTGRSSDNQTTGSRFKNTTISLGTQNNIQKPIEESTAGFYCSNTLEIDKLEIQKALKRSEVRNVSPRVRTKKAVSKVKKGKSSKRAQ